MKIVSIDIESSGLDSELDQILSIGVVIEDTNNILPLDKVPQIHIIIPRERISGNPFALDMNRDLITSIKSYNSLSKEQKDIDKGKSNIKNDWYIQEGMVSYWIAKFLEANGFKVEDGQIHINVLGKNFATFDKLFLEKLPKWSTFLKIRHRILDPSILATDWNEDSSLPNLKKCMERSGFDDSKIVTHNALQDSLDTLEVLRKLTNNYTKWQN